MKVAAVLTSRVMDSIGRLPGVATLDWCDRAAAAFCRMHHPSAAMAALVSMDGKGFIEKIEVAGCAMSVAQPDGPLNDGMTNHGPQSPASAGQRPTTRRPMADAANVSHLRESLKEGDWIGWNVGGLSENLWFVSTASQQGLLGARGESPLMRRWEPYGVTDILLGAVTLPGRSAGRFLLIEIASSDSAFRSSEREQAVMAAALPMLSQRLHAAVGDEVVDKHTWLTPREELILWHLVAGKKVPQIASELHRSVYTVHDHVKSLHRKMGASNRGQLVARALGHLGPASLPIDADSSDVAPGEPRKGVSRARK